MGGQTGGGGFFGLDATADDWDMAETSQMMMQ
jgi:hypothetical protein